MTSGGPLVEPGPAITGPDLARYARHVSLPGVGVDGQRRLAAARVLVLGAGGLGSPALLYLAAAGVGTIGIVDDDVVDASNLQRQVIHGVGDVGVAKVDSAATTIAGLNPQVAVVRHQERLTSDNALDLFAQYDVILDGCDNFPTRYLVSDAAEITSKPVVWGSIYQFAGQVSVFWANPGPGGTGVTYRDVFPTPPTPGEVPDCATGGVFGAMCATIGSVMATEAIKLITGIGDTLLGRIVIFDSLAMTWNEIGIKPDPTRVPVRELDEDYPAFCGLRPHPGSTGAPAAVAPASATAVGSATSDAAASAASGASASGASVPSADRDAVFSTVAAASGMTFAEVGVRHAAQMLETPGAAVILDVREPWEAHIVGIPGATLVPFDEFHGPRAAAALAALPADQPVLVICKTGARSALIAAQARAAGIDARNVAGGMMAWVRELEPQWPTY